MAHQFRYDLRYSFDPVTFNSQQKTDLMNFLRQSTTDGVTFFINQEELNQGHVTASQADAWLNVIKELTPELHQLGVKVSLNPWTTLLHSDRGAQINPQLGFRNMVDYTGEAAVAIACPGDERWQAYLAQIYAHYATILPDYLWLEDDFRHFSHSPHITWGCFCEHHLRLYAQKLGYALDREEFVKRILQAGPPTPERKAYLTVAREEMITTAAQVAQQVHAISPKTKLGLMCSFPEMHAVEGRDWSRLIAALAGKAGAAIRPHLPAYEEVAGVIYSRTFNQYSRPTAALVPQKTQIFPELENYMYSPYAKSRRFTQFQLESSAILASNGILLNLYDMIGSGIVPDFDYAAMLKESRPLMEFLTKNRLIERKGIKVLFNPNEVFYRQSSQPGKFPGLYPQANKMLALLATMGLPVYPEVLQNQQYIDEIIVLSGQVLRGLAPREMQNLLENNVVILDGEAIQVIIDAGLKDLLNITQSQWHQARTNYQSYEQYRMPLAQVSQPRVSMLQHIGAYLQIQYQPNSSTQVISDAYNSRSEKLGPVMTVVNQKTILLPLAVDPKYGWGSQYTNFKAAAFKMLLSQISDVPTVVQMPAVNLNWGRSAATENERFLLVNFSLDNYPLIRLHLPQFNSQELTFKVTRRQGEQLVSNKVVAAKKANYYELAVPLPGLSIIDLTIED